VSIIFSQKALLTEKYIITESTHNEYDRTEIDIERKGYFKFYNTDKQELYFANLSDNNDDQSYGKVLNLKATETEETDSTYGSEVINFRWKYYNTYDDETGYATIRIVKIYKRIGIAFTLTMLLPDLDVFEYKGYIDSEEEDE